MTADVPRLGHRPGLTGLRGAAILLVLGFHVGRTQLPGGFVGVDLFFALSGFLITTLLLEELREHGRLDFGAFYRRRARRLFPALGAMLLVTAAAVPLLDPEDRGPMVTAIASSAAYVANYFAAGGTPMGFTHTWSLALEEQFYLLWPLALVAMAGVRRTWLAALPVAVLVMCSVAGAVLAVSGVGSPDLLYFGPLGHLQPLMAGCCAGILFATGRLPTSARWWRPALAVAAVAGGLFILWMARTSGSDDPLLHRGLFIPLSLACAALVLAAVEGVPRPMARVLAWSPAQEAGRISYSLYLWHPLVMALTVVTSATRAVVVMAISLVLAELSYRVIERPFLRRPSAAIAVQSAGDGPLKSERRPLSA